MESICTVPFEVCVDMSAWKEQCSEGGCLRKLAAITAHPLVLASVKHCLYYRSKYCILIDRTLIVSVL